MSNIQLGLKYKLLRKHYSMVPYLTTALTGPLLDLEKRLLDAQPTIEHWFRQQWKEQSAPTNSACCSSPRTIRATRSTCRTSRYSRTSCARRASLCALAP